MGSGRGGPAGPHFKAGPVKSVIKEESGEIESSESLHSITARGAASGQAAADHMDMGRPTSQYTKRGGGGGSSSQTPTSPDISHREAGLKSDGAGPSRARRTAEPNGRQLVSNK